MKRGEFTGLLERNGNNDQLTALKLLLLSRAAIRSSAGEKWAAVVVKSRLDDGNCRSEAHFNITCLSDFVQMDGFQTDEGHIEQDGYHYHQLTVFWGDGKSIYEAQHRLGEVDQQLLVSAS